MLSLTNLLEVFFSFLDGFEQLRPQLLESVEKTEKHFQQVGQREHLRLVVGRSPSDLIADSTSRAQNRGFGFKADRGLDASA